MFMSYKIKKIHLSIDRQGYEATDYKNNNTDVIVEMENGNVYIASFFTYNNLEAIRAENRKSGAFLAGKYFWTEKMVFIEEIDLEIIKEVIQDLAEEGDFRKAFRKL